MEDQLNQKDIVYLKEAINELKTATTNGFANVNVRLDIMTETFIKREELYRELADRDKEIEALKDNQKWVVRTIIGVVLVALISLLIVNT